MRSVRYLILWTMILVAIYPSNVVSGATAPLTTLDRINAPYLPDGIYYRHTAVAWLGQVPPTISIPLKMPSTSACTL